MKTLEQLGISPAPWNARKVSRGEGFTGFEVYDDNGNYVLFDGDAGFANCNLIAAAPKLYEACYEMLRYYYEQNTNTTVFNTALELMKQAVAEAAGESEVEE